jgi:4-hydroxy-tetrahydrodipicolinate reductase
MKLAVVGASGRMGRAIIRLAVERGHALVCAVAASDQGRDAGDVAGVGRLGVAITDRAEVLLSGGFDTVVDFSSKTMTFTLAEMAGKVGASIVSGTTGLDDATHAALDVASKHVAVLWEPNMSVGVAVLGELVRTAVRRLGHDFDVEIVEVHHRQKADAPSGTALKLADIARDARGDAGVLTHGRSGRPGARPPAEIGLHALRGGDVIGDHTVHLLAAGERLELTHRASSRELFAHGALRAAEWMLGKPAGRYALRDVLG